jgi:hypothetical protein
MVGEPQVAMRVTSQIWQVVFASQTLPVFCFSLRNKAQYVVVQIEFFCNIGTIKWKATNFILRTKKRIMCKKLISFEILSVWW